MSARALIGANNQASNKSQGINLGKVPPEGPRVYTDGFDFSATGSNGAPIYKNYSLADLGMTMAQCIFIDNSMNNQFVSFEINGFNVSCQANATQYAPLLITGLLINIAAVSPGLNIVEIAILNVLIPAYSSLLAFGSGTIPAANVAITNTPLPILISADTPILPVNVQNEVTVKPDPLSVFTVVPSVPLPVVPSGTTPFPVAQIAPTTAAMQTNTSGLNYGQPIRIWSISVVVAGTTTGSMKDNAGNICFIIPNVVGIYNFEGGFPFLGASGSFTIACGTGMTIYLSYSRT